MAEVAANKGLGHARPPIRAPIGLQHDTRAIGPKTVTQHRDRFWTSTSSDDSGRLRTNLGLILVTLEVSWNYISNHIKCAQIRVRMQPWHPF